MKGFIKAQISSLIASAADFITTLFLIALFSIDFSFAMVIGAISGAGTNFLINRYWAFDAASRPVRKQSIRYALVWLGSLLLNVAATFVFVNYFGVLFIVSRLVVAIIVGWSFNYILQKKFVFVVS